MASDASIQSVKKTYRWSPLDFEKDKQDHGYTKWEILKKIKDGTIEQHKPIGVIIMPGSRSLSVNVLNKDLETMKY